MSRYNVNSGLSRHFSDVQSTPLIVKVGWIPGHIRNNEIHIVLVRGWIFLDYVRQRTEQFPEKRENSTMESGAEQGLNSALAANHADFI